MSDGFEFDVDFDRSRPIDFGLRLATNADRLHHLAEVVENEVRAGAIRSRVSVLGRALDCLLANLVRVRSADERGFLAISMRAEAFSRSRNGRYRSPPASRSAFHRCIGFLSEFRPQLLEFKSGFNDTRTGIGRVTKIRATKELIPFLEASGLIGGDRCNGYILSDLVERTGVFEPIRLKDESKTLIDYEDDESTHKMRLRLCAWNAFARAHWIDVLVKDGDAVGFLSRKDEQDNFDLAAEEDARHPSGFQLPDFTSNQLYRVFNRSSFSLGGRLYGGWWQNIPSDLRPNIMINGHPTREIDFSAFHMALLYAKEGLDLEGDAYDLPGVDRKFRNIVKHASMVMINAEPGKRSKSPPRDLLPMEWPELLNALKEKHSPIAKYFHSGAGLRLQRVDSDIAEAVMIRMGRAGRLVLPVHDSFIVQQQDFEQLQSEMTQAFAEATGKEVRVKAELSFIDNVIGTRVGTMEAADFDLALQVLDHVIGDDHTKYREREASFYRAHHLERYPSELGSDWYEQLARQSFREVPELPITHVSSV